MNTTNTYTMAGEYRGVTQPMQPAMQCAVGLKEKSSIICHSPAVKRRMELLRHGLPKSAALDSLMQKILVQQARLRAKDAERANAGKQTSRVTRKVCQVAPSAKGQSQRIYHLFHAGNS